MTIFPTVGEIARRTNEPTHRVEYVIRTRNIQPSGWAGNLRIFAEDDVERIADELRRIDENKSVEVSQPQRAPQPTAQPRPQPTAGGGYNDVKRPGVGETPRQVLPNERKS